MKFKKISAVLGTFLLTGLTLGTAAAANFPAPFVDDGVADVAIVYGTGAGVSSLDMVQAESIQTALSGSVDGAVTTVDGGETFDLFKDTTKLHFGDAINAVYSSTLDDGDLDSLMDGDYDSGDIDVEYEQTLSLGSTALSLITDSDLNDEEPTIGYYFDDANVLTYTMSFRDEVHTADMIKTDMPLFGSDYYVLDADTTKVTLLNSAEKTVITEGEPVTIDGHSISIDYITTDKVKFNVDGESTDKLADGEYFKLEDDYYIVLSENLYTEKDGSVSKAEISFGSGKVVLEDGQDVEVNDDSIDGLSVAFTTNGTAGYLTDVAITWDTDGEVFLTEGNSISMPVFDAFSLAFGGLDFGESEDISFDSGETLTMNMGNYDLELMFNDSSDTYLGGKNAKLITATTTDAPSAYFAIADGERFLATLIDTDLQDVETAYYEFASSNNDTDKFDLKLDNLIDTADDIEAVDQNPGKDYDGTNSINVEVVAVYDAGQTVSAAHNTTFNNVSGTGYVDAADASAIADFAVLNVSAASNLMWDTVVSDSGMVITIPTTAGVDQDITFYEADEDGDLQWSTSSFILSTAFDSDDDLYAKVKSATPGITMVDELADNKEVGYNDGIHATKVMEDTDANTLDIEYYIDEVTADLVLVAGGEISTVNDALGDVLVKDTEVDSVSSKNLIIVGGSCINSAAATVLGGAYCGAAFTDATGVGAGQFLIKGVQDAYTTGKLALVVAGYEAADTVNAATYLTKKDNIDTSKTYKGTSATAAELVVA